MLGHQIKNKPVNSAIDMHRPETSSDDTWLHFKSRERKKNYQKLTKEALRNVKNVPGE